MTEDHCQFFLYQILRGMKYVHSAKVIHRDLKPSNIFMKSSIDICIGDFGVATVMGDARTKTRTMVGSMNWMAPEVGHHLLASLGCVDEIGRQFHLGRVVPRAISLVPW